MKGIILAGGSGTRLYPITKATCKQLLPVYDKPLIYYPLSVLMLSGINDILIISTPQDSGRFYNLLGDGSWLGIKLSYAVQEKPNGIAEAFLIGKNFIGNDTVALVLGDNILFGHGLIAHLLDSKTIVHTDNHAVIFAYYVKDPQQYGVVEFDEKLNAISIEEKPAKPRSNYAVIGLYFYPNDVVKKAKSITPGNRGELEITSINQLYLDQNNLKVKVMGRGFAWLDTGTHDSLLEASNFVKIIEERTGLKIGCVEEIAFKNGWITKEQVLLIAKSLSKTDYSQYLITIAGK